MIVLDTNVISETQKKRPEPRVMAWLDAQDLTNLYLTAITAEEIMFGVLCMDSGERQARLKDAFETIITEDFGGRVLPYDGEAASWYANRVSQARRSGIAIGHADGQIAAIALANHGVAVATRDRSPFDALGVDVIDPWTDGTASAGAP